MAIYYILIFLTVLSGLSCLCIRLCGTGDNSRRHNLMRRVSAKYKVLRAKFRNSYVGKRIRYFAALVRAFFTAIWDALKNNKLVTRIKNWEGLAAFCFFVQTIGQKLAKIVLRYELVMDHAVTALIQKLRDLKPVQAITKTKAVSKILSFRPDALIQNNTLVQKYTSSKFAAKIGPKDHTCTVFFGIVFLMLCLRSVVCGCDVINYEFAFYDFPRQLKDLSSGINLYDFEIGFVLLSVIVEFIFRHFRVFLILLACISWLPIYVLYRKESENQLLSIAIFLTLGMLSLYFSALRQVVALAFAVPAFYYAKKKRLGSFIGIVIIAMLFHTSAAVLLLLYPAFSIKLRNRQIYWLLPLLVLLFVAKGPVFTVMLSLIGKAGELQGTGAYGVLVLLFAFFLFSFIIPDESKATDDFFALRNILVLALVFQMFAPMHSLAMRLNYYFLIFVPIAISKVQPIARQGLQPLAKLGVAVMILFFILTYVFGIRPGDIMAIYPYVPFWMG